MVCPALDFPEKNGKAWCGSRVSEIARPDFHKQWMLVELGRLYGQFGTMLGEPGTAGSPTRHDRDKHVEGTERISKKEGSSHCMLFQVAPKLLTVSESASFERDCGLAALNPAFRKISISEGRVEGRAQKDQPAQKGGAVGMPWRRCERRLRKTLREEQRNGSSLGQYLPVFKHQGRHLT